MKRTTFFRGTAVLGVFALLGGCASGGSRPVAVAAALDTMPRTLPARSARDDLRMAIDSMLSDPQFRSAHWGVLIVDADRGDTLYSRNAGKLFMPASNQKILTGATAIALLGPDYRFRTSYAVRGIVRDSVLRGDLVVIGRGDPSVSDHMRKDAMEPLRELADSLRAHSVKRVTGDVVADGDAFPGATYGYGWAYDQLDEDYSAGVDELLFNEGFTRVIVRGGSRAGAPVTAATLPTRNYPALRVLATTVPPRTDTVGQRPDGQPIVRHATDVHVTFDGASSGLAITGTVAINDSLEVAVAHRDPSAAYLAALREALAERGIIIDRRPQMLAARRAAPNATPGSGGQVGARPAAALDTLFAVISPPLREIMPVLQKPSQNQIAEVLLRTLGLERTGVGSADSGRRVVERQLLAWGAEPDGFAVRDGSGLSRYDYVSPETIVRVLAAVRRDTAFAVFYDALPIAGVDGTIAKRMRGTPAQGNVHAKTGFVDKARSLSGYVTTADGRMLVFSALCNNWTSPVSAVERVQDAIGARLAAMTLASP